MRSARRRPLRFRLLAAAEWAERAAALPGPNRASPLPAIAEQIARSEACAEPVRLIEISDAGTTLALIPVVSEQRSIRGIRLRLAVTPGENFFDYLPSPLGAGIAFADLHAVVLRAVAALDADALLLPHLLPPLSCAGNSEQHLSVNRYFDAILAGKGWASLTRRESLRRHRNRARGGLAYRVEHFAGALPRAVLAAIAELHRERWAFDGMPSAFEAPSRILEYLACEQRVVLSIVYDGETPVAAHIGLRYDDVLLWHTPVINLRYLAFSPLELLLLETAEECARRGIRVLDFGLGDEPYKERFGNATRPWGNLFVPRTWRGRLAGFLLRRSSLDGMRARLARLKMCLAGSERGEWLVAPAGPADSVEAGTGEAVGEFSRLVDLYRNQRWPLRRTHYERLRRGEIFLAANPHAASIGRCIGVWIRIDTVFPADAARPERRFATAVAVLHDFVGDVRGAEATWAALASAGTVRRLIPQASAADVLIRLRRDQEALRAVLLAAGAQPALN